MFPSFNEDRLEKSLIIFVLSFRLNLSWDSWIVEGRTCFFENCFRFQILKKNWPQMLTSAVVMIISWWVWLLDSYQHPVSSVMRPNVHFSAQPEATTVSCQGPLEQVCTDMWTARTWKRVCDVRRSPIFYFFFSTICLSFNHSRRHTLKFAHWQSTPSLLWTAHETPQWPNKHFTLVRAAIPWQMMDSKPSQTQQSHQGRSQTPIRVKAAGALFSLQFLPA